MKISRIEKIIRFTLPKYTIRVWLQESLDYQYSITGMSDIELTAHSHQDLPMRDLLYKLLEFDNVVAAEALDWSLSGMRIEK